MDTSKMFYRLNDDGDAVILFKSDGEVVTMLDADVFPVGFPLCVRYEHPRGIVLTVADAKSLGIDEE